MRTSAPRLSRLLKRSQFQAAAGDGRRFRSSEMTVQVRDREIAAEGSGNEPGIRIGLTASRKVGNAVKRNRIRRRLRAAAREAFAGCSQNADVVAVARTETITAPYEQLVRTLHNALTKARPQRKQQAESSGSVQQPRPNHLAAGHPVAGALQTDEMNREDNKNLLLAIVLSAVVLLGWNYFYGVPQMESQRRAAVPTQPAAPGSVTPQPGGATSIAPVPGSPGAATPGTVAPGAQPVVVGGAMTREAAVQAGPRIVIETPRMSGSIALTGGRIDDVLLMAYRETVDPKSPHIVLFSPQNSPNPYYADFGWAAGAGATTPLPGAQTVWTADQQKLTPAQPVNLSWNNGQGLIFKRRISVDANAMFSVTDTVENTGGAPITLFPYGLVARHGKPVTQGYFVLHEGLIGVIGSNGLQEYTYDNVEKEGVLGGAQRGKVWKDATSGFLGITDKYWAAAIIPDQERKFEGRFSVNMSGNKTFQADYLGDAVTIAPGASGTATTRLFAGAKEVATIDGYEKSQNIKRFDLMIDWGWFYFITKPMFYAIDWFFHLTGNFGIAILLVTVVLKLLFFPLANKSYASMAKMKAVQPEMVAIRDRFADDKMKQQQALMELYKKEKINPLAGCWPVLIQIPVFFALYKVLFVTIEMRHAPFFGWIRDLAAPDPTSIFNLFGLLPFAVPAMLLLGVWPILMGITMFVQMKLNPEPTDPVQKMVFTWMPVFFTFLLGSFPAGLVIYWTWNNFLSIAQQAYIMKKFGTKIELWDNIKGMFAKKPAAEPGK
jgi:YidC/Oxa1 family membrane protein insertase